MAWDSPGHGESSALCATTTADLADALWHVLDDAEINDAVLVGHSMGGFIAQYAALARPERVRALVMVDTSPVTVPYAPREMRAMESSPRWILLEHLHPAGATSLDGAAGPSLGDRQRVRDWR